VDKDLLKMNFMKIRKMAKKASKKRRRKVIKKVVEPTPL